MDRQQDVHKSPCGGPPGWAEAWVQMPGPSQPLPCSHAARWAQDGLQADPSPVPNLEGHLYEKGLDQASFKIKVAKDREA